MSQNPFEFVGGNQGADQWLLTTAIGGDYLERWFATARPLWEEYAERHGLGVAVAVGDLFEAGEPELNGAWQKLLAPRALKKVLQHDFRCALLDTDVLISPRASNVFDEVLPGNIGIVSQQNGLPLDYFALRRRIAFLRKTFLQASFPLDSALVASPQSLFRHAGLEAPEAEDFFCSGVVVVDSSAHGELFASWYRDAPTDVMYSRVDWGEELWLNSCVQGRRDVQWLDYSWQALWLYEVAANYPFLYSLRVGPEAAQWCLGSSLLRNNFVHLAGRWEVGLLGDWRPKFPDFGSFEEIAELLHDHEQMALEGNLRGVILPDGPERKS